MNTNSEDWCRIFCGQCKWFNVNADREGFESTCKRLDHKHLRFAKPVFKSYDCGQFGGCCVCSDFYPNKSARWLYEHWEEVKKQIITYKENELIGLCVDGDFDTIYKVKVTDFYNNTFLNKDGTLKWVLKTYCKSSRKSPTGYEIIKEYNTQ